LFQNSARSATRPGHFIHLNFLAQIIPTILAGDRQNLIVHRTKC